MKLEKDPVFRAILLLMGFAIVVAVLADALAHRSVPAASAAARTATLAPLNSSTYEPVAHSFILTTVPLLVHEQAGMFDYLGKDFGKHGMLRGKEVWGFSPSSITVYQGDTVNLTVANPSGDPHTFTIPDLSLNIDVPAQGSGRGTFVASRVGVFTFACMVEEHNPYMWGQLIVLPDGAAT